MPRQIIIIMIPYTNTIPPKKEDSIMLFRWISEIHGNGTIYIDNDPPPIPVHILLRSHRILPRPHRIEPSSHRIEPRLRRI